MFDFDGIFPFWLIDTPHQSHWSTRVIMRSSTDDKDESPLFVAKPGKERTCRRVVACSMFVGILLILIYRWTHIPAGGKLERLVWIGMFVSEIWFGFYYVLTQSTRWSPLHYSTFTDKLSQRYHLLHLLVCLVFQKHYYFIACCLVFQKIELLISSVYLWAQPPFDPSRFTSRCVGFFFKLIVNELKRYLKS